MRRWLVLSIVLLNLTACQHYTSASVNQQSLQLRQQQDHWVVTGLASVQYQTHFIPTAMVWQQFDRQHYQIKLDGPANSFHLLLKADRGVVTLWETPTQFIRAKSPEALLTKVLGWSLPVSQMFYWLRDLPAPGHYTAAKYDQYGRLVQLQQNGWHLNWVGFIRQKGADYPTRIGMNRMTSQGTMSIFVRLKQWDLNHHAAH